MTLLISISHVIIFGRCHFSQKYSSGTPREEFPRTTLAYGMGKTVFKIPHLFPNMLRTQCDQTSCNLNFYPRVLPEAIVTTQEISNRDCLSVNHRKAINFKPVFPVEIYRYDQFPSQALVQSALSFSSPVCVNQMATGCQNYTSPQSKP